MKIEDIKSLIRSVPDFPKEGILFRDITTVLQNPVALQATIDNAVASIKHLDVDIIAGIESRGFIFGMPIAQALGKGFVPIRKKGKLPAKTIAVEYALEYGTDTLEIHADALSDGMKVLIVDDLLATGGTACASAELVEKCGGTVAAFSFVIELDFLKGKEKLSHYPLYSLIHF